MLRRTPTSTLFPYTTLFRSRAATSIDDLEDQFQRRKKRELEQARMAGATNGNTPQQVVRGAAKDRKSTRLNSSHANISYAVFCLKKKKDPDSRSRKLS